MPPEWDFVTDGTTFINPVGMGFTLLMCLLMLVLPRRYALLPILILMCYMTMGMRVMVAGMNFTMMRILLVFGWLRILMRGEARGLTFHKVDRFILIWSFIGVIMYVLLWQSFDAIKYKFGGLYTVLGFYYMFRFLIRDAEDCARVFRMLAILVVPLAGLMIVEKMTARNMFSAFGGVPAITFERSGSLRCQGPFAHPILAGTMGASIISYMLYLFRDRKSVLVAIIGSVSALVIVITCSSSGPLFALFSGVFGMALWRLRKQMKSVFWAAIAMLVLLHLTMKAPVWFILARVDIVGGSTGYHRALLIDRALANLPDWWLMGTESTASWASDDDHLFDVTNQYLLYGAEGGVAPMIAFFYVLGSAFRAVGRIVRTPGSELLDARRCAWALGAALFAHAMNFISVSYFDQNGINFLLLLAMIASTSTAFHRSLRSQAENPGAPMQAAITDRPAEAWA